MRDCWQEHPDDRPTFENLRDGLKEMENQHQVKYIQMEAVVSLKTVNGKHYKQLHGTAMGSPVSVVVAEIVMQNIEERALTTCRQTIPL